MTDLITALPSGLVPPMKEIEGNERPAVRIETPEIVIPVLVRKETRDVYMQDGENEYVGEADFYRYFEVRTAFDGGDINDYAGILSHYWKPLREAFYGSMEFQADLEYDHRKTAHILAVKDTFRKPGQTAPPDGIARWTEIKEDFKNIINRVLASVGKDRSVLPDYFNDKYMLQWAHDNEVPEDVVKEAKADLMLVSCNLNANGRNWAELFR